MIAIFATPTTTVKASSTLATAATTVATVDEPLVDSI